MREKLTCSEMNERAVCAVTKSNKYDQWGFEEDLGNA